MVMVRPAPDWPEVPKGRITVEKILQWYEEYVVELEIALELCHQDKRAIQNWNTGK